MTPTPGKFYQSKYTGRIFQCEKLEDRSVKMNLVAGDWGESRMESGDFIWFALAACDAQFTEVHYEQTGQATESSQSIPPIPTRAAPQAPTGDSAAPSDRAQSSVP